MKRAILLLTILMLGATASAAKKHKKSLVATNTGHLVCRFRSAGFFQPDTVFDWNLNTATAVVKVGRQKLITYREVSYDIINPSPFGGAGLRIVTNQGFGSDIPLLFLDSAAAVINWSNGGELSEGVSAVYGKSPVLVGRPIPGVFDNSEYGVVGECVSSTRSTESISNGGGGRGGKGCRRSHQTSGGGRGNQG